VGKGAVFLKIQEQGGRRGYEKKKKKTVELIDSHGTGEKTREEKPPITSTSAPEKGKALRNEKYLPSRKSHQALL